mgnify:CR=1 FL=1
MLKAAEPHSLDLPFFSCVVWWLGRSEPGLQPLPGSNPAAFLFWFAYITLVAFFVLNLYVGVVFYQFQRLKMLSQTGSAVLTASQTVSCCCPGVPLAHCRTACQCYLMTCKPALEGPPESVLHCCLLAWLMPMSASIWAVRAVLTEPLRLTSTTACVRPVWVSCY